MYISKAPNSGSLPSSGSISDYVATQFFSTDLAKYGYQKNIPFANIIETESYFIIALAVSEMHKENFHVYVENSTLFIKAKEATLLKKSDAGSHQENHVRSFTRSFALPETVSPEGVKTDYIKGVLEITLSKKKFLMMSSN